LSPFEYLMLLTAVILGLAVCDLAISVHRLLAAGGRVRWDWLAPLAALVAFLKIVSQWWTFFNAGPLAKGLTFEMFLGVLVASVLLFLLAADALPDETGDGWIDLRAHWASVSRRFWLLFVSQFVLLTAVSTWAQVVIEKAHLNLLSPAWLVLPAALLLALWKNRWWQTLGLLGFAVVYIAQYFGQHLGQGLTP
jgi:hypothetical protein